MSSPPRTPGRGRRRNPIRGGRVTPGMPPTGLAPPSEAAGAPDSPPVEPGAGTRSVLPPATRRSLPGRFFGTPLWISFAAHLIAMMGLMLYVWFGPDPAGSRPTGLEEVQFVDLRDSSIPLPDNAEAAGPSGSDAEAGEVAPEVPQAPVEAAPEAGGAPAAEVPPRVITAEGGETEVAQPDEGGEAGGGGVAERLRPGFSDPRLYADPEAMRITRPQRSGAERYQEQLQARIDAMNDSIYGRRGPNSDWTVRDGSGNRWGVSEEGVHLGPLTIPRALVPVPAPSGSNQDLEQERERQRQREEIQRQEADRERREALEESRAAARERREQGGSGDPR